MSCIKIIPKGGPGIECIHSQCLAAIDLESWYSDVQMPLLIHISHNKTAAAVTTTRKKNLAYQLHCVAQFHQLTTKLMA
jgi:hypothetical protein